MDRLLPVTGRHLTSIPPHDHHAGAARVSARYAAPRSPLGLLVRAACHAGEGAPGQRQEGRTGSRATTPTQVSTSTRPPLPRYHSHEPPIPIRDSFEFQAHIGPVPSPVSCLQRLGEQCPARAALPAALPGGRLPRGATTAHRRAARRVGPQGAAQAPRLRRLHGPLLQGRVSMDSLHDMILTISFKLGACVRALCVAAFGRGRWGAAGLLVLPKGKQFVVKKLATAITTTPARQQQDGAGACHPPPPSLTTHRLRDLTAVLPDAIQSLPVSTWRPLSECTVAPPPRYLLPPSPMPTRPPFPPGRCPRPWHHTRPAPPPPATRPWWTASGSSLTWPR